MFEGPSAAWHASLALRVRSVRGRSLVASTHRGPLRLQKGLHPEGDSPCHAVLLHPPGGIAGGDTLDVSVDVQPHAHALITTPGAAKWYKANGRSASQRIHLTVAGTLEWLPQEAIVYDGARVDSSIDIALASGAAMIGWDIVALGRRASGEAFNDGEFRQSIRLHRDGELHWVERTRLTGGDRLLDSPIGLAGQHVFGCLWAAGPAIGDDTMEQLRADLGSTLLRAPLTRPTPGLLVARTLGTTTQAVRMALADIWCALRPAFTGRAPHLPRIWAT
jgi:urease accessory protein